MLTRDFGVRGGHGDVMNAGHVMEPSHVGRWLKQPNPAFEGSIPLQGIERGETDRIKRLVHELASGQPG